MSLKNPMSNLPLRNHDHWELLWHRNPQSQGLDALDGRPNWLSFRYIEIPVEKCCLGKCLPQKGRTTTQLPPRSLTYLSSQAKYSNKIRQMSMSEYKLFCVIENNSTPFSVTIGTDETVDDLKERIKDKN